LATSDNPLINGGSPSWLRDTSSSPVHRAFSPNLIKLYSSLR
jgi:hypothetical protein